MINLTRKSETAVTTESEVLLAAYFTTVFPDLAAKYPVQNFAWTLSLLNTHPESSRVIGTYKSDDGFTLGINVALGDNLSIASMQLLDCTDSDSAPKYISDQESASPMQELEIRSSVVKEQPSLVTREQANNFISHMIWDPVIDDDDDDDDIPEFTSMTVSALAGFKRTMAGLAESFEESIKDIFRKRNLQEMYIDHPEIEFLTANADQVVAHFKTDHFDTFFSELNPVDQVAITQYILTKDEEGD